MHGEELGDRICGTVAGYLLWDGLIDTGPRAISVVEQITQRQLGPVGRELVSVAAAPLGVAGRLGHELTRPRPIEPTVPIVIELRGLRAVGYCGALPEEQERAQPFEVDLDVEADLVRPGRTDELADTARLRRHRRRRRAGRSPPSGSRCSSGWRPASPRSCWPTRGPRPVTVTVRKLRPPVPQHLDTSGVRIRRDALTCGPSSGSAPTWATVRRTSATRSGRSSGVVGGVAGLRDRSGRRARRPGRRTSTSSSSSTPTSTPHALLGVCHRLESAAGRVREERWGPRTLDVDILWIESGPVDEPDLDDPPPPDGRAPVRDGAARRPRARSWCPTTGTTGPRAGSAGSARSEPLRAVTAVPTLRVIGAGRAGRSLALALAQAGWRVGPMLGPRRRRVGRGRRASTCW